MLITICIHIPQETQPTRNKKTVIEIERNTLPYYRYKPEPALGSANIVLYWDRFVITDQTVDFNIPDITFIDREKKIALIIDIAVPLTHNLSNIEAEKITKYENLTLEIKNIRKLSNVSVCTLVISVE